MKISIDKTLGSFIFPDGSFNSFGIHSFKDNKSPLYNHSSSFLLLMKNKDFNKKVSGLLKTYDIDVNIHAQVYLFSLNRIIVIMNYSYMFDNNKFFLYRLCIPNNISIDQLNILNDNYTYFKKLEDSGAVFEIELYDLVDEKEVINSIDGIDKLYKIINGEIDVKYRK